MSVTVKAADAAEFLAIVPRLLGCTPTRSLVLVPMGHGKSLGALRLDLPDEENSDVVASSAIGMLCRISEADAFIAVIYTDECIGGGDLPGQPLIESLTIRADACGLHITDALTVAADAWGSHLDTALPSGGRALSELDVSRATRAALIDAGAESQPLGDQAAGARLRRVDASERREVAQALRSLSTALEAICGIPAMTSAEPRIDPAALEAASELDDLPALFESVLAETGPRAPMRTAMIGWCLSRPALRDIALVQWASDQSGGDVAMEAQRRWEDGAEYPADLASVMWGEAPRPTIPRIETALDVVREVAALMPQKHRPGSLAMCAWLSWALGRSSHADRYAAMALAIDRRHGLSEIVRSFVRAGHLPDWAFRRC